VAARSPTAKSAKANGQRGKPRDTAAATAGERTARPDAATAAKESELAGTVAAALATALEAAAGGQRIGTIRRIYSYISTRAPRAGVEYRFTP